MARFVNRSLLTRLFMKLLLFLTAVIIGSSFWVLSHGPFQTFHRFRDDLQPGTKTENEIWSTSASLVPRNINSVVFILDASSSYRVFPNVFSSDLRKELNISSEYSVTLVSHCTLQHLRLVPDLVERWLAPMSLAIFVPAHLLNRLLDLLKIVRKCHGVVQRFVSFHIIVPLEITKISARSVDLENFDFSDDCDLLPSLLRESTREKNYENVPYPGNLLRNTGRKYSETNFTLVIDIDFLPSYNLSSDFHQLVVRRGKDINEKEVFVVPAFEIQSGVYSSSVKAIPGDKRQLMHFLDKLAARPFYFETCWKCQKFTDYQKWQNLPLQNGLLDVAYQVLWQDPWEPFYISSNKAPIFDERFKQYGFNRISQVCELHVAGYSFSILNFAFVVHKGFKTSGSFHGTKTMEQELNRQLFRLFKTEVSSKYSDSTRKCW